MVAARPKTRSRAAEPKQEAKRKPRRLPPTGKLADKSKRRRSEQQHQLESATSKKQTVAGKMLT